MPEPEAPPISALLARLLRERYPPPRPFPTRPITLVLLRQEVHDMLPDLNRVPLLPLKDGVHPSFVFTLTRYQFSEPEAPLDLEQIRRQV